MSTHILIVETPDTIPDPEFRIEARVKGTIDERIPVEFREVVLPDESETNVIIVDVIKDDENTNLSSYLLMHKAVDYLKSLLQ